MELRGQLPFFQGVCGDVAEEGNGALLFRQNQLHLRGTLERGG
jgi:hypothetical protein